MGEQARPGPSTPAAPLLRAVMCCLLVVASPCCRSAPVVARRLPSAAANTSKGRGTWAAAFLSRPGHGSRLGRHRDFSCPAPSGDGPAPAGPAEEGGRRRRRGRPWALNSAAEGEGRGAAVGGTFAPLSVTGVRHAVDGQPIEALGPPGVSVRMLRREEWQGRAQAHRDRVLRLLGGSVKHDSSNPVANFLFQYYHFRPKALLEYSPGLGVLLQGARPDDELLARRGLPVGAEGQGEEEEGVMFVPYGPDGGMSRKHETALRMALEILRNTVDRPPIFFCYGTHEWAMLYRPAWASAEPVRYQQLPLRVSQQVLNEYVESRPIRCTHFDAFRFFTPEARPLNVYAPQLGKREEAQPALEQPGCLHANMDLFKWCMKLGPLAPSELVADSLALALECRVLDMRASPYDLRSWAGAGLFEVSPVPIETAEGRAEYAALQEALAVRAGPIRRELIGHYEAALRAVERIAEQQQQQQEERGT